MISQLNFDEVLKQKYKITKPIRLIELFAGIGATAKALKNLGANLKHYRVCEFNKEAMKSYNAVHATSFAPSDICKWRGEDLGIADTSEHEYILTYSFPCQDLSLAGKGAGMEENSKTRSSLLWEVSRLLHETRAKPQVLIMENVPAVHGTKNISEFRKWLLMLEKLGYDTYWQDLNAKDYGIPQSRNRTFAVSVPKGFYYSFPETTKLVHRLRDILEKDVPEKYYLKEKTIKSLVEYNKRNKDNGNGFNYVIASENAKVIGTIIARCADGKTSLIAETLNIHNCNVKGYSRMNGSIVSSGGICPTLRAFSGGNNEQLIIEPVICAMRGRAPDNPTSRKSGQKVVQMLEVKTDGTSNTLTTVEKDNLVLIPDKADENIFWRIRRLMPIECWRLMGFSDDDFNKAKAAAVSERQLYRQAGNSICVGVLESIFKGFW